VRVTHRRQPTGKRLKLVSEETALDEDGNAGANIGQLGAASTILVGLEG
jgi:hypothetical protein